MKLTKYKYATCALTLLSVMSCTPNVVNNDVVFKVGNFSGSGCYIGDKVKLKFEVESNFKYELDSVKILEGKKDDKNRKSFSYTNFNKVEKDGKDYYAFETQTIMNSSEKYFELVEVKYKKIESGEEALYTTSELFCTVEQIVIENVDGEVILLDWGLSNYSIPYKDWETAKESFYVYFKFETTLNAHVETSNSFVINGETYSVLKDKEDPTLYKCVDIKYDIVPSKSNETVVINFESYKYSNNGVDSKIQNVSQCPNIAITHNIKFTEGVIDNTSCTIQEKALVDSYNRKIVEKDSVLNISVKFRNPTHNKLIKAEIDTNFGKITCEQKGIIISTENYDKTRYIAKFNIELRTLFKSDVIPGTLTFKGVNLVFLDGKDDSSAQEVKNIFIAKNYEIDVYTKFIYNLEELKSINNVVGSFILMNDIDATIENDFLPSGNSTINVLKGVLNGNKKKIIRSEHCHSFINKIEKNGKLYDLNYECGLEINNMNSIYYEGTPSKRFADGRFDDNFDYSTSSLLVGINEGSIQKIKISGSIGYYRLEPQKNNANAFTGIVGINNGSLKDLELSLRAIDFTSHGSGFYNNTREFSFITQKNNGTIDGVFINDISKGFTLGNSPTNPFINGGFPNLSFYLTCKENNGTISNLLFNESFFHGSSRATEQYIDPLIHQINFYPGIKGQNSKIINYFVSTNTLDEFFSNKPDSNNTMTLTFCKFNEPSNYQKDEYRFNKGYEALVKKYGEQTIKNSPEYALVEKEGEQTYEKFNVKYLVFDYIPDVVDSNGNLLYDQTIKKVEYQEMFTTGFDNIFKNRTFKGDLIWYSDSINEHMGMSDFKTR